MEIEINGNHNIKMDDDFEVYDVANLQNSVFTFNSNVFTDERGYFSEIWKNGCFPEPFSNSSWIKQCNVSKSHKGVFRGMHMQKGDSVQGKFVRCINGALIDVIIDMRPHSKSFRKVKTYGLSCENGLGLWVPRGFLHGFFSMFDSTVLQYMCDSVYDKSSECGVNVKSILEDRCMVFPKDGVHRYLLGLMKDKMILSEKDSALPEIVDFESDVLDVHLR